MRFRTTTLPCRAQCALLVRTLTALWSTNLLLWGQIQIGPSFGQYCKYYVAPTASELLGIGWSWIVAYIG
jgi:hypothetical protein